MSNTLKRGSGKKLVSRKENWTVGGLNSGQCDFIPSSFRTMRKNMKAEPQSTRKVR